jgi:phage tail sheath gpL-like
MGINRESNLPADLQVGPTSLGMVRVYIATEQVELPLDFDPDEAEEIADELRAAADRARQIARKAGRRRKGDGQR